MSIYRIRQKPSGSWVIERASSAAWYEVQGFRSFEATCVAYAKVADERLEQANRWLEDRIANVADTIDDGGYIGAGGGVKAVLEHMLEHTVEWQTSADNIRLLQNLLEEVS